MAKVNVTDEFGNVVARVEYNSNLDTWDGSNRSSGSTGRHLGITKLVKSDQFVLIHGTDWQGERDSAEVVGDEVALQAILRANKEELLDQPKFKRLKELWESIQDDEEVN